VENKIKFARKILHGDNNKQLLKPTTSKDNQEEKENLGYENFDNAANPLMLFNCSTKEVPIQEPLGETANIMSSTSVLQQNKLPLTIGNCNNCTFNVFVQK
jgi:hypothetical protein